MTSPTKASWFNFRPLLAGGAVLFLGMTVANVGAYALNLVVGRLLGPVEFGSFVSLVSVAAILTMPGTGLSTVAAKFAASADVDHQSAALRGLAQFIERLAGWFGLVLAVLMIALAGPIQGFLHLASVAPVIVLAVSFSVSFFVPALRGLLQGLHQFGSLSFNTALEPLIKLIAAIGLIRIGFGVSGAVASYGIAFACCYVAARWVLRQTMRGGSVSPIDRGAVWRYSLPTMATLIALSLLTSVDVILAKHYFSPADAGIYAGLATIGKIVLYVATPLVAVMFPLIATKISRGERHITLLVQTLALMIVGSFAVLALFVLFPSQSVTLLFGQRYLAAAPHLASYGLAMLLLSLVTVFVHYFLSIGFTRVSWLVWIGLGLELILLRCFHAGLAQVITGLLWAFGSLLVLLAGTYGWLKRQQLAQLFR